MRIETTLVGILSNYLVTYELDYMYMYMYVGGFHKLR